MNPITANYLGGVCNAWSFGWLLAGGTWPAAAVAFVLGVGLIVYGAVTE